MKLYKNLLKIIFIVCLASCSSGSPVSPEDAIPTEKREDVQSAKITNFYLYIVNVHYDSTVHFQTSVVNDGDTGLENVIIRFRGESCPANGTKWIDTIMAEYIVDIEVSKEMTPPREGYISSFTYNNCYMGSEWMPGATFNIIAEILTSEGFLLDRRIKTFNADDAGFQIGSDNYR